VNSQISSLAGPSLPPPRATSSAKTEARQVNQAWHKYHTLVAEKETASDVVNELETFGAAWKQFEDNVGSRVKGKKITDHKLEIVMHCLDQSVTTTRKKLAAAQKDPGFWARKWNEINVRYFDGIDPKIIAQDAHEFAMLQERELRDTFRRIAERGNGMIHRLVAQIDSVHGGKSSPDDSLDTVVLAQHAAAKEKAGEGNDPLIARYHERMPDPEFRKTFETLLEASGQFSSLEQKTIAWGHHPHSPRNETLFETARHFRRALEQLQSVQSHAQKTGDGKLIEQASRDWFRLDTQPRFSATPGGLHAPIPAPNHEPLQLTAKAI
jgi:hypothetical protein